MSVPYSIIFCEKCHATWSSLILNGYFEYILTNGHCVNVERNLGWCHSCNSVVPVERLPRKDEVTANLQDAERALSQELASSPTTITQRWIWRFSKKKRDRFERTISFRKSAVNKCVSKLELLSLRTDPEKCLKCGSVIIISYEDLPVFTSTEQRHFILPPPKQTNYMHPGCGGVLSLKTSGGLRLSVEHPKHIYDVNGNLTRSSPVSRM
jgi:hypothetical protein